MGHFVVKADTDLYMLWCTVMDAPEVIGTRAEMLE